MAETACVRVQRNGGNFKTFSCGILYNCSSLKMRAVTTVPRFPVTAICILSALFTACRSSDRHLSRFLDSVIDKRRYYFKK